MRRKVAGTENQVVASLQDADSPHSPTPTLRSFVACMGLLGFRAAGTRNTEMRLAFK